MSRTSAPRAAFANKAFIRILAFACVAMIAAGDRAQAEPTAPEPEAPEAADLSSEDPTIEIKAPAHQSSSGTRDPVAAYAEQISGWTADVYARRGEPLIWIEPSGRVSEKALSGLRIVQRADEDGLDPGDYFTVALATELERLKDAPGASEQELARLDALVTKSLVMYTHDLAHGRLNPYRLGIVGGQAVRPSRVDVPAFVAALSTEGGIEEAIIALRPRRREYDRLRSALPRYRRFAAGGPWPKVPEGPVMKPGEPQAWERVDALARRLQAEELLDTRTVKRPSDGAAVPYEQGIAAGVKRFQSLRGLAVDGVVGPRTLAELNRTPAELVRTIALNLERWRWLPDDLGVMDVRVNIPAFELTAYEDGEPKLRMPIIVGQVTWGTPLFSDRIRTVILNPFWNVPQSIARKEVLAKVFADRSYLARESMEIVSGSGPETRVVAPSEVNWAALEPQTFPYRLRQRPGPLNPLGRIKFLFPNEFNVYMHDTPSGRLFALPERAFSHGCVRIAKPLDLAAWLFKDDPRWSGTRIEDAIKAGARDAIPVKQTVAVHIVYFTAVAHDDGMLEIYKDLYGIDAKMERSLRELSDARLLDRAPR